MSARSFLAFDLGAESGRAILGLLEDGKLRTRELHRFNNPMLRIQGTWYWNVYSIFEEIKYSLKACAEADIVQPKSMAIDTWGVDFGLFAADGKLLSLPVTYRDSRTEGIMDRFFEIVPKEKLYSLTGLQFLPFNTLFQLYAMKTMNSPILDAATDLLFMPDIFNYFLTGEKSTEYTFATTSQLLNSSNRKWEDSLFHAIGAPVSLMQDIVEPGAVLANIDQSICDETGIGRTPVTACASHDTGSAVAATPAEGEDWAYISSGTWSLMGVENKKPVLSSRALELQFTNEGGLNGFRFLKNIMGLWLLQQCRKAWLSSGSSFSYDELMAMAGTASFFKSLIDPDRMEFLNPPDMLVAISDRCKNTGQPIPENPAEFTRTIMESLALKYRFTLDQLRQVHDRPINRIYIIGGGARNEMLCALTANATGLPVYAGPFEATAIGNIIVQAIATGDIASPGKAREVVKRSSNIKRYQPEGASEWDRAYNRFLEISS